jgi:hypothetical protein
VSTASRIGMLLRPACAVWLVALSASPFTAPFRTCDISMLFENGAMASRTSLPISSGEAARRDASLQPSSVAVTTVRVRFPLLTAVGDRWLVASPGVARSAPSAPAPDEGAHSPRLFVLRI